MKQLRQPVFITERNFVVYMVPEVHNLRLAGPLVLSLVMVLLLEEPWGHVENHLARVRECTVHVSLCPLLQPLGFDPGSSTFRPQLD